MPKTWILVVSRDHALRGVTGGFIMANHGKRAPLARMSVGDRIAIYSPRTSHPDGEPLKAVAVIGEVIGVEPEPSEVIPGGFRRGATLKQIEPVPLESLKEYIPTARLRFGCFDLSREQADGLWRVIDAARAG